jgi:hypothetical protein
MLSDALHSFGDGISAAQLETLTCGCLSPHHATQFRAFVKQIRNKYALSAIIAGEQKLPRDPEDRDTLYFLAQSFRTRLVKELPRNKNNLSGDALTLSVRGKKIMKDLAGISLEIAQMAVAPEDGDTLPDWFMAEIVRDLPRLAEKKGK